VTKKKKTRGEIGTDVTEIQGAARRASSPVPRALDDMEELSLPGAREIATLTVIARSQDWQFEPLMKAMEAASQIKDWSHSFMVAQRVKGDKFGPRFNWRDAPFKRYRDFKDFYKRELEPTWGKWETLQHTWSEVVKGRITEEEGRKIILRGHGGRPRKDENRGQQEDVSTVLKPGERNTKIHWMARLDQDRPDLAEKVRAKTMSATAAAIEAGFRKKVERPKVTILDRLMKLWAKASADERIEFLAEAKEGGSIMSVVTFPVPLRKHHNSPDNMRALDCPLCDYAVWVDELALDAVGPPVCPRHQIALVPVVYDDD
jgi:hypothetical protein